jgi:hypothetical protein
VGQGGGGKSNQRTGADVDGAKGERVVFYCSFACPGGVKDSDNVATLLDELKGKYTLASLRTALWHA